VDNIGRNGEMAPDSILIAQNGGWPLLTNELNAINMLRMVGSREATGSARDHIWTGNYTSSRLHCCDPLRFMMIA
jgi:hypothetical protein